MNTVHIISVVLSTMLVTACASVAPQPIEKQDALYKRCDNPRPQICTREYRPVCGVRNSGIGGLKTYGNACAACADVHVIEYREGECKSVNSVPK